MEWIKANKAWMAGIIALIVGGVLAIMGVITWEDFISLFERVSIPVEGGG